jgi:hypothetical protein
MLRMHKAAVCIQRHFRGHAVRLDVSMQAAAAVRVQAHWRAYVQQRQFQRTKAAAVTLQATTRGWLARKAYLRTTVAVVCIQVCVLTPPLTHPPCKLYRSRPLPRISLHTSLCFTVPRALWASDGCTWPRTDVNENWTCDD